MRNIEGTSGGDPARKQSMRWPLIVTGLLFCHVVLMLSVAAIAVRDPSFSVLPNYYQKALNWDQSQAAKRESAKLGWTIRIEPATTIDPLGQRSVKFILRDGDDCAISDAKLNLTYYHHSRASDTKSVALIESAPGEFVAKLPMRMSGFYQFELSAETKGACFATSVTQYVETEAVK